MFGKVADAIAHDLFTGDIPISVFDGCAQGRIAYQ